MKVFVLFFIKYTYPLRQEGRCVWDSSRLPCEVYLAGWTEGCGGQGGHGAALFVLFFSSHTPSLDVSFAGSRTEPQEAAHRLWVD